MIEEEPKNDSINIKSYQIIDEIKDDEEKKENQIIKSNPKENFETIENFDNRFKPKIKLNIKKQRYPYCIVWTPIPCFTWVFPSIGHVGICNSKGIIYDFASPYYVSIDNMAFGNPTKYVLLDFDGREFDKYDQSIEEGAQDYNDKNYSFCFNNCHSYVARCLNKLKYKGRTNYTMINIWWILLIKGKYISMNTFWQTYIGFFVMLIIGLGIFFLFKI